MSLHRLITECMHKSVEVDTIGASGISSYQGTITGFDDYFLRLETVKGENVYLGLKQIRAIREPKSF